MNKFYFLTLYCDNKDTNTGFGYYDRLQDIIEDIHELSCINPMYNYRLIDNETGEVLLDTDITHNTYHKIMAEQHNCTAANSF